MYLQNPFLTENGQMQTSQAVLNANGVLSLSGSFPEQEPNCNVITGGYDGMDRTGGLYWVYAFGPELKRIGGEQELIGEGTQVILCRGDNSAPFELVSKQAAAYDYLCNIWFSGPNILVGNTGDTVSLIYVGGVWLVLNAYTSLATALGELTTINEQILALAKSTVSITNATSFSVTHNKGVPVFWAVIDSTGQQVSGVQATTNNGTDLVLSWSIPVTGTVVYF